MIELSGTLIERLNEAIRLVCTPVSEKELAGFIALYEKAGIELLPSAIDYFKQYGGAYRNSYIMLTDPKRNKDISLNCFDTITDFYYSSAFDPVETEKDMLRRLDWAMDDIETVREFTGQNICPIGEVGYTYPALVYIGEDSKLYCIYEWTEDIGVFDTPAQILEAYLRNNIPIGVDTMPIRADIDDYPTEVRTKMSTPGTARLEYGDDFFEIRCFSHSEEDEKSGNPYNCSFTMKVRSGEFSGQSHCCECDYKDIKKLITQLEELVNFKTDEAVFRELAYDSTIRFAGDGCGHITVSGTIYGDAKIQSLQFEFMTDQTVYPSFISDLKRL